MKGEKDKEIKKLESKWAEERGEGERGGDWDKEMKKVESQWSELPTPCVTTTSTIHCCAAWLLGEIAMARGRQIRWRGGLGGRPPAAAAGRDAR